MGVVAGGGPKDVKILGAKRGNSLPQYKQTIVHMPYAVLTCIWKKFMAFYLTVRESVIRVSQRLLATRLL